MRNQHVIHNIYLLPSRVSELWVRVCNLCGARLPPPGATRGNHRHVLGVVYEVLGSTHECRRGTGRLRTPSGRSPHIMTCRGAVPRPIFSPPSIASRFISVSTDSRGLKPNLYACCGALDQIPLLLSHRNARAGFQPIARIQLQQIHISTAENTPIAQRRCCWKGKPIHSTEQCSTVTACMKWR